jgi:hypothetical protein
MGISRYNAAGYLDMTAHLAIQNVERDEKILHIGHPTGYIDIRMDAFFPCTVKRGAKVFRLVRQYSPTADKHRLLTFLLKKAQRYASQIKSFEGQIAENGKEKDAKYLSQQLKDAQRKLAMTQRNIAQFKEMTGYNTEEV